MAKTQPEPVRDPKADHLLTPQNCVLVLIDYQPEQYSSVTSSSREEITLNAVALCKLAQAYNIPVVLSTVAVDMGVNEGTIPEIRAALPGVQEIDRTGVNAWQDDDFRKAVQDTGRRKVVIGALWTEVCLAFRPSTCWRKATRSIQWPTPSAAFRPSTQFRAAGSRSGSSAQSGQT